VKIATIESRQNRKGSSDKLQAATEWLIVSFIGSHTPYVLFPLHSAKVLPSFSALVAALREFFFPIA